MKTVLAALALLAAPPALALVAASAPDSANPNAPPPANAPPVNVQAAPVVGSDEPLPDPRLEADAQRLIAGLGRPASAEIRAEVRARLARGETPAMVRDALAASPAAAPAGTPAAAPASRPSLIVPLLFVGACAAIALVAFGRRKPKTVAPRP